MRLKEIEERLAAIKNELTTRAAELKEEEITALENEVTALQEERAAIKAAAEKRSALLARIAAGESVGDGEGAGSDKQKKNIAKDGMITFAYHKLRCAVAVSLEVDTMAISAFETLLINNIVEAMTKALEQAIIDGNGTGKPKGILAETPADGQTIESAAPSYSDLIKAEGALPMAYENGAVWCMSKKTFMEYVGMTDKNGQPIAKVNYGTSGKPERTLLGRTVVLCDYVASYSAALAKDTIFAFLFNFKDYVLNTNYSMGVKKYEDNDTDDQITKGIMLVDGKVVDKNSLVVVKKIEAV